MIVKNIGVKRDGSDAIFSADFIAEAFQPKRKRYLLLQKLLSIFHIKRIGHRIWFKLPQSQIRRTRYEDSFFVLAYPLALALGENLYFDGKVSAKLLKNINKIKKELRLEARIKVFTNGTAARKDSIKKGSGQFFTLGIDSFHTFFTKKPKYLIFALGLDIPLSKRRFFGMVKDRIKKVAKASNSHALFAETNLRTLSDKIINWDLFFGAALVSVALFFKTKVSKVWINGSFVPDDKGYGTSPKLDRLWSTEYMSFHPSGYVESRVQKAIEMKKSELFYLAADNLRVCWENVNVKGRSGFNCSKCEKCLRTQLCLLAAGAEVNTFEKLNVDNFEPVKIQRVSIGQWKAIYNTYRIKKNADPKVVKFLEKSINISKV